MPFNPEHLKNLKPFTKENANSMRERGLEVRLANKQVRESFLLTAKNFMKIKEELPMLSPLDVINMAMIKALGEENFEDAARYANMMTPYTNPKLQAIEQRISTDVKSLTDEELKLLVHEAGIRLTHEEDNDG